MRSRDTVFSPAGRGSSAARTAFNAVSTQSREDSYKRTPARVAAGAGFAGGGPSPSRFSTPRQERGANAFARPGGSLPPALQAGVRMMSGVGMEGVRVHYNSSRPPALRARAYTQGNNIYVAPGQEKYLPHEAWHVVQQRQGRVRPTARLNGVPINDNPRLEKEACQKGAQAERLGASRRNADSQTSPERGENSDPSPSASPGGGVAQRATGFELEVDIPVSRRTLPADAQPSATRDPALDWANARRPFPEADPHGAPPVPQTVIYGYTAGGVTVDAVPDKKRLAPGMPRQIVEIRVSPIDTINTAGLGATMANVRTGIDHLYDGIVAGRPRRNRFPIPVQGPAAPAMVGLPRRPDPSGTFNEADRNKVGWRTYMQATSGIRTDRISNLAREIHSGGGSLQSPTRRHRDIANQARAVALRVYARAHRRVANPDHGNPRAKNAVIGYLTLIAMYLLGGSRVYQGQGNLNPKNLAAVFSRSGFDQIRTQTLTPASANWIATNHLVFRDSLVRSARTTRDGLRSGLFNRTGMRNPTNTVGEFLEDALRGAPDRYTNAEAKAILPPEAVEAPAPPPAAAPAPGPVLEFRNIRNPGNDPAQWVATMTNVINDIHNLNA